MEVSAAAVVVGDGMWPSLVQNSTCRRPSRRAFIESSGVIGQAVGFGGGWHGRAEREAQRSGVTHSGAAMRRWRTSGDGTAGGNSHLRAEHEVTPSYTHRLLFSVNGGERPQRRLRHLIRVGLNYTGIVYQVYIVKVCLKLDFRILAFRVHVRVQASRV